MSRRSFEQVIQLNEVEKVRPVDDLVFGALANVIFDQDAFTNTYYPAWSWPGSNVLPGGTIMAQAVAAAYKTVGADFSIDALNTYFLSGPNPANALHFKVRRLSDGGRFATRTVYVEQEGKVKVHIFCSFVRASGMKGPTMRHAVTRQSQQVIESITLDDLEVGANHLGPYMKFQRLPLTFARTERTSEKLQPQSKIYTSVATISPPLSTSSPQLHALGIIGLSDYHILDAVPTLHGLTFGLPHIDDATRTRTHRNFKFFTSLNHAIHFHIHEGFRADDLCYIEVTSPWANDSRGEIHSRIFDREGNLIATCVQEAYYVLKDQKDGSHL